MGLQKKDYHAVYGITGSRHHLLRKAAKNQYIYDGTFYFTKRFFILNLSENAKQFSLRFSYTDNSVNTFFAFLCSFGIKNLTAP